MTSDLVTHLRDPKGGEHSRHSVPLLAQNVGPGSAVHTEPAEELGYKAVEGPSLSSLLCAARM